MISTTSEGGGNCNLDACRSTERERIFCMSDFIPKPGGSKIGGLGPKAQRLQALREKAAHKENGAKQGPGASTQSIKGKDAFAGSKKTSFQRKSV